MKTCAIFRCGGIGDIAYVANILPELKAQGYHITLYASFPNAQCIEHDKYLDVIKVHIPSEVPYEKLFTFWEEESKKYDKWINLSESVEGQLLALPGRVNYYYDYETREKLLNKNYWKHTADIAGVPYNLNVKFYPTDKEIEWAKSYDSYDKRIICWSLAGSQLHKVSPHVYDIVSNILDKFEDVEVILLGSEKDAALGEPLKHESRVHNMAGVWSIRESLTFVQRNAALLISPESGIVTWMAFENLPKIVLLSHSNTNTLTKDWINTTSLQVNRQDLPCGGCCHYRMIYGWDQAMLHEPTGTTMCQALIKPELIWESIIQSLEISQ